MKTRLYLLCLIIASLGVVAFISGSNKLMKIMERTMTDMKNMHLTEDQNNNFALLTKRHHEGAIQMARLEIKKGRDEAIKTIASRMLLEMQKDNRTLDAFLASHIPHSVSDFEERSIAMLDESKTLSVQLTKNIDIDFALIMIEHHNDGINMATEYLKAGKETITVTIAKEDIALHTSDNILLKRWLASKGREYSFLDPAIPPIISRK